MEELDYPRMYESLRNISEYGLEQFVAQWANLNPRWGVEVTMGDYPPSIDLVISFEKKEGRTIAAILKDDFPPARLFHLAELGLLPIYDLYRSVCTKYGLKAWGYMLDDNNIKFPLRLKVPYYVNSLQSVASNMEALPLKEKAS